MRRWIARVIAPIELQGHRLTPGEVVVVTPGAAQPVAAVRPLPVDVLAVLDALDAGALDPQGPVPLDGLPLPRPRDRQVM